MAVTSNDNTGNHHGGSAHATITPAEIAVIVVLVVTLILFLASIGYCRILRARRKKDLENKAATNEHPQSMGDPRQGHDSIEMNNMGSRSAGTQTQKFSKRPRVNFDNASIAPLVSEADPEAQKKEQIRQAMLDKPPLWNYIHWKNPVGDRPANKDSTSET
jgi:hypothetical protein